MAARSDGEHYGELIIYRFPKQELVYGPLQIEGRIDQNPEISAQITLWDQGGSKVIRGNLLVLPIENALLYVEPLYLQAENGQIPELKRVILASGDQIVMQQILSEALDALLKDKRQQPSTAAMEKTDTLSIEQSASPEGEPPADLPALPTEDIGELARMATEHYAAAQEALKTGDWTTYGAEMGKVQTILEALVRLTDESEK